MLDCVSKAALTDARSKTQFDILRVCNPGRGDAWLMADHGQATSIVPVGTNSSLRTWLKFTAPAAGRVTLRVSAASGTFEDVPIAKGSSAGSVRLATVASGAPSQRCGAQQPLDALHEPLPALLPIT